MSAISNRVHADAFAPATGDLFKKMAGTNEALRLSDGWICRTIRSELEDMGLLRPEDEAPHFSCKNRFYNGQLGGRILTG